ncbi:hypothetical protein RFI_20108, partial [Reticulomyxa filosa]
KEIFALNSLQEQNKQNKSFNSQLVLRALKSAYNKCGDICYHLERHYDCIQNYSKTFELLKQLCAQPSNQLKKTHLCQEIADCLETLALVNLGMGNVTEAATLLEEYLKCCKNELNKTEVELEEQQTLLDELKLTYLNNPN